jgi:hypothetical protein
MGCLLQHQGQDQDVPGRRAHQGAYDGHQGAH